MTVGRISKALRFEVLTRDGYRCRYCGASAETTELHMDHVVPRAAGGRDTADNLVTACVACNYGKADRKIVGIPVGFSLTPDKRPARLEKMRRGLAAANGDEHILNCDNIEEWDELNDGLQLVWVWCNTHSKYEWHSVPLDYVEGGGIYQTSSKEVSW